MIDALIGWAAPAIGVVAAVLAAWLAGRRSGKKLADLKNAESTIEQADENRRTRHDADRDARNDDDPVGRLRDRWSRD